MHKNVSVARAVPDPAGKLSSSQFLKNGKEPKTEGKME